MDLISLQKISYGLYVLTSADGDRHNGCIINTAIQQTSVEPVLVSVTVSKANLTHDIILKSGKFNISVLDQTADFEIFAKSLDYGNSKQRQSRITTIRQVRTEAKAKIED